MLQGAEEYCIGLERTIFGGWTSFEPPVWFRIGINETGNACYAQLNMELPRGVAPYQVQRFKVEREDGGARTILRYLDTVLTIDEASRTIERQQGEGAVEPAVWLEPPPEPVLLTPPPPPESVRARWYGIWLGRIIAMPFDQVMRLGPPTGEGGEKEGRIAIQLGSTSIEGWFHGEMLVFRWKDRHVGMHLEPDTDTLRYTDFKGRVFRFRRR